MEYKYSEKLINETIKVFKEEDNLDISIETACDYLDSLSGLFLAFTDNSQPANAFGFAGDSDLLSVDKIQGSPDLITPHSCNN